MVLPTTKIGTVGFLNYKRKKREKDFKVRSGARECSEEVVGVRPPCAMCAKRSPLAPLRAQRCAARRQRLCVRRPTCPRTWQVLREQEGACVYAELQSKHRAAYGDDEAAREAAGKAALLRAKESLSTGWAARLCCEQRGRLVAAWPCRLRGVRQRGLFKPLIWPESARQREPRERGQGFRVPVCACAVIVGVCMPQRGAPVCVECRG